MTYNLHSNYISGRVAFPNPAHYLPYAPRRALPTPPRAARPLPTPPIITLSPPTPPPIVILSPRPIRVLRRPTTFTDPISRSSSTDSTASFTSSTAAVCDDPISRPSSTDSITSTTAVVGF